MRFKWVLALSPHTDDVELGAGGTVARLVDEGASVDLIAFSRGKATKAEAIASAKVLGVNIIEIEQLPARWFPSKRQEILEELTDRPELNPDLVLCPSSFDFHQDHQVVYAEALRAFRTCTILGYELPWSCRQFDAQCLVRLERRHHMTKLQALHCYWSQTDKDYFEIVRQLSRVRGVQGGCEHAEAFEVIRWVM